VQVVKISVSRDNREIAEEGSRRDPHVIVGHFSLATRNIPASFRHTNVCINNGLSIQVDSDQLIKRYGKGVLFRRTPFIALGQNFQLAMSND